MMNNKKSKCEKSITRKFEFRKNEASLTFPPVAMTKGSVFSMKYSIDTAMHLFRYLQYKNVILVLIAVVLLLIYFGSIYYVGIRLENVIFPRFVSLIKNTM